MSISLDPERDTPEALREYARVRGADLSGWSFLTGSVEDVEAVVKAYGVGSTRIASAVVEQYHDDEGITWPLALAPFHVHLVPTKYQDEVQRTHADEIYAALQARGLLPGDHVAILAENVPRYYDVYWAALRSGLYLTAINRFLSAEEAAGVHRRFSGS